MGGEYFWILIAIIVLLVAFLRYVSLIWAGRKRDSNQQVVAAKRKEETCKAIESFLAKHPVPQRSAEILAASVEEIVSKTRSGEWSVEEVVLTYICQASKVHRELNCITEVLFDYALERARFLDNVKDKSGVLFGVPISIKDSFEIAGSVCSLGVLKWKDRRSKNNSRIVELLLEAGAIPFCKTNVPQTMLSFECCNPLFGQTENPFLPGFSPGGSSGGEAALIGKGGSVLGVGSDIGGSLRIPAHFSGICALKPSPNRISMEGSKSFRPASLILDSVGGPMARSVSDLIPFMEACCGKADIDVPPSEPITVPREWKKLKVGVINRLNYVGVLPPITRAIEEAKAALQADGHEIVNFELPFDDKEVISIFYRALSADSGHYHLSTLKGEPIEPALRPFFGLWTKSPWLLRVYKQLVRKYRDYRPSFLLSCFGEKSAIEITELIAERKRLIRLLNDAWARAGIDCLIMPAFAMAATPHGAFAFVSSAAVYTSVWNVLDYVAGVVPVTKVDAKQDAISFNEKDLDVRKSARLFEAAMEKVFKVERMAGLPVGVQIITPQYCETTALHAMLLLENALKKHPKPVSSAR